MAEASVPPRPSAKDNMAAKQPPPLMKKHSQTDLVSRLKTRKILGVGGEDDDGEVHRSKVSHAVKGGPRKERRPGHRTAGAFGFPVPLGPSAVAAE